MAIANGLKGRRWRFEEGNTVKSDDMEDIPVMGCFLP
jgi:hypothetical protein